MKYFVLLTFICLITCSIALAQPQGPVPNHHEVKYIIFMVPDGMGLADVTAARIQKNGPAGEPLWLETLEHVGYQRTYSEKNTITDSSAAASAWACGEKFINNEVCFHADGRPNNPSLLELAATHGMGTGLVVTQALTEATPAAFGSHVVSRTCQQEVARQYAQSTHPDVMLGGGLSKFVSTTPDACGTSGNYVGELLSLGYTYATTSVELHTALQTNPQKLLGLFANGSLTLEALRSSSSTQPHLVDMTAAALSVLENHSNGFFLLVEGSQIDTCNHGESFPCQYMEVVAFDNAVKQVLDWIGTTPERREHTLLIIAVDHETGGFGLKGTEDPAAQPFGYFEPSWLFTLSTADPIAHHTGGDVMIWSEGPGSEVLSHAIENTSVYDVVRTVMK